MLEIVVACNTACPSHCSDLQVSAAHKREFKCTHTHTDAHGAAASAMRRVRQTKATTNDCQSQKQQIKSISEQQQQ